MTTKDLQIIDSLLERTENLPDILHIRAAPRGYKFTEKDNELLHETYQKLDDILKEVAAFINVKFPGRHDHIRAWNDIDFDTKLGGIKIITTDREHMKAAWRSGIFDLKSLIKSLKYEVLLLTDDGKPNLDAMFDDREWDKHFDELLDKRVDQADFFLDLIMEKGLIKLDKPALRRHFKNWFKENQDFDLQIKDGSFAIEDGDFQFVPNFHKDNIPEFLKWFNNEGESFMSYLKEHDISVKDISKVDIINHGSLIINKDSKIKKQTSKNGKEPAETIWTKANVIIALIVGIATIIGIVWGIWG